MSCFTQCYPSLLPNFLRSSHNFSSKIMKRENSVRMAVRANSFVRTYRSTKKSCCSPTWTISGAVRASKGDRQIAERERKRGRVSRVPRPRSFTLPRRAASSPASERAARERVTADREGRARRSPKTAEHGRTVVRIAAPASVLKPRPRFTVHNIRALPRWHFFARPGPGSHTRKKTGVGALSAGSRPEKSGRGRDDSALATTGSVRTRRRRAAEGREAGGET